MRMWHKDLIEVLPDRHLVGQWRELSAIMTMIRKDTLKHPLVDKVLDFPYSHLYNYTMLVKNTMDSRNITNSHMIWNKLLALVPESQQIKLSVAELYVKERQPRKTGIDWHNERYLRQCLYNLQEKYDCGIVSKKDWIVISREFKKYVPEAVM